MCAPAQQDWGRERGTEGEGSRENLHENAEWSREAKAAGIAMIEERARGGRGARRAGSEEVFRKEGSWRILRRG